MQTTSQKSANAAAQYAASRELVEWIRSAAGQSAVDSAVKNSFAAISHLSESRKIQPDQLHVPITL
jgi:hypothetical protein